MKQINDTLSSLGAQKFKYLGTLLCFVADIIFIYYVNQSLLPSMITPQKMKAMIALSNQIPLEQVPPDMVIMLSQSLASSLGLMFFIFLCVNFVIYLLNLGKRKWPKTYVLRYAQSTVLLSLFELAFYLIKMGKVNKYTLGTTVLYAITAYGYRYFRKTEEL